MCNTHYTRKKYLFLGDNLSSISKINKKAFADTLLKFDGFNEQLLTKKHREDCLFEASVIVKVSFIKLHHNHEVCIQTA